MQHNKRKSFTARLTFVIVVLVIVFELSLCSGLLELKAETVGRIAPWAYEPFLTLVGEHPDFQSRWNDVYRNVESKDISDYIGFIPSAMPAIMLPQTNLTENVIEFDEDTNLPVPPVTANLSVVSTTNMTAPKRTNLISKTTKEIDILDPVDSFVLPTNQVKESTPPKATEMDENIPVG